MHKNNIGWSFRKWDRFWLGSHFAMALACIGVVQSMSAGDQTVHLSLSGGSGAKLGSRSNAVLPIRNTPSMYFASGSSANEADGAITMTVSRRGATDVASTVDYRTIDGTAIAGQDYIAKSGTLSFAAGEESKTFNIEIIDDGQVDSEFEEYFHIQLENPTTGWVVGTGDPWPRIFDNEIPAVLDPSFNPDLPGAVLQSVIDSDGRLVVLIAANETSPDDSVFWLDDSGSVLKTFHAEGSIQRFFPLSDGRFLVYGWFATTNGWLQLARFNSDGSFDPAFQPTPKVIEEFNSSAVISSADGRLFLSGPNGPVAVNSNGSPDLTFFDPTMSGVVFVDAQNRILVAGNFTFSDAEVPLSFAWLSPNGFVDYALNRITISDPVAGYVSTILVQPDSRILIGGRFESINGMAKTNLARLHPDGSVDETFNFAGGVGCFWGGLCNGAMLQDDGRILIFAGGTELEGGPTRVYRFNSDGSRDTTYSPLLLYSPSRFSVRDFQTSGQSLYVSIRDESARINGISVAQKVVKVRLNPPRSAVSILSRGRAMGHLSAIETAGRVPLIMQRFGETTGSATISYETRDRRAKANLDYLAETEVVTFAPLETEKIIYLSLLDDTVFDPDETLELVITSATGVQSIGSPMVFTIHDGAIRLNSDLSVASGRVQGTFYDSDNRVSARAAWIEQSFDLMTWVRPLTSIWPVSENVWGWDVPKPERSPSFYRIILP
jgi:uncharacterized delta-60 repeat protein